MLEDKEMKEISIVIPLNNEERNITLIYRKLNEILSSLRRSYEIIFVDAGSADGTYRVLNGIYQSDKCVNIIRLSDNFGQTAALAARISFSKGKTVITMDGDMQHDPIDIAKFLEKIDQGYDLVCSWRKARTDNLFTRRIPSAIANKMLRLFFKTNLRDFGSNYRAYSRKAINNIKLYSQFHRFIPALVNYRYARFLFPVIAESLESPSTAYQE